MRKWDMVILGGGIRGLNMAILASHFGLTAAVIEPASQWAESSLDSQWELDRAWAYLEKVIEWFQAADRLGLVKRPCSLNMSMVKDSVRTMIHQIQAQSKDMEHVHETCHVIRDSPKFIDEYTLRVHNQSIQSKQFIIMTGSIPVLPLIPGLSHIPYFTEDTIFQALQIPQHLMIVGSGTVTLEIAQAFHRLGSRVTIIDKNPSALPNWDKDISEQLQTILMYEGIEFYFSMIVKGCKKNGYHIVLDCTSTQLGDIELTGSHLLVVTERKANTEALGLEHAKIKIDALKRIVVDKMNRTSNKRVYAIGGVTNAPNCCTDIMEYQIGIIIASFMFSFPKKLNNYSIPSVISTDPPLVHIGLNEETAAFYGLRPQIIRYMSSKSRMAIEGACGETKLLIDRGYLIGATLLGDQVDHLIAEIILAIQTKTPLRKLINSHVEGYPILSTMIKGTYGECHMPKLMHRLNPDWLF